MTEPVGSLAEEAAKLLGAADAWWRQHVPAAEPAAAECKVCPFCQLLSVVRQAQPDLVDRVSEAAVALLAALRPETPDHAPQRADVPVERIDIA